MGRVKLIFTQPQRIQCITATPKATAAGPAFDPGAAALPARTVQSADYLPHGSDDEIRAGRNRYALHEGAGRAGDAARHCALGHE